MTRYPFNAPAPLIGIAGWKNSGKTTLAVRLVEEFAKRGLRVATIKHAHHNLRLDDDGTDSARHRHAGARQVAVVSSKRWAIMTENGDEPEIDFTDVIARLDPCDLIIVEGYKSQPIPKIEARRRESAPGLQLAEKDAYVIAIAADHPIENAEVPVFDLDEPSAIADFIADQFAITQTGSGAAHGGKRLNSVIRAVRLAGLICCIGLPAIAKEPDVPAGLDPGGIAVALLGSGIDYTRRELAKRLARDGEGDLIAWDFTDNDIRPYAADSQSTLDAEYIVQNSTDLSLVVVKEPPGNPAAIGHMASFTIRTPARILVWPDGVPQRPDWPVLFQAAQRFTDRLFVVAGPVKPIDGLLPVNIIAPVPDQKGDVRIAALDLAIRAADVLSKGAADLTIVDLRRKLIQKPQ